MQQGLMQTEHDLHLYSLTNNMIRTLPDIGMVKEEIAD